MGGGRGFVCKGLKNTGKFEPLIKSNNYGLDDVEITGEVAGRLARVRFGRCASKKGILQF